MKNIIEFFDEIIHHGSVWSKINLFFYTVFVISLLVLIVGGCLGYDTIALKGAIGVFVGVIPPVVINTVRHFVEKD